MSVADKFAQKSSQRGAQGKQMRLHLAHVSVWSAAKLSFLIGLCLGVASALATLLAWTLLNQTGTLDQLDHTLSGLSTGGSSTLKSLLGPSQVIGLSALEIALDVILSTIAGPILAALYNLSIKATGGLLIGFSDK